MMFLVVVGSRMPRSIDVYHSPFDLIYSPDGAYLAVSDHTANLLYLVEASSGKVKYSVSLNERPTGVAWSAKETVLVAEYGTGTVAEVDVRSGKVTRRFKVGPKPVGVAIAPVSGKAVVSSFGLRDAAVIDLQTGGVLKRIPSGGPAYFLEITRDEKTVIIGNLLPALRATDPSSASEITLICLDSLRVVGRIRLPYGSSNIRKIDVSPDGKWAYAVHTRGRVKIPTSQLERGWVNTNAVSIIDIPGRSLFATVLLDYPAEGAADPWGAVVSNDGEVLWVTIAGVNQIAKIDLTRLHQLLNGEVPLDQIKGIKQSVDGKPTTWERILQDAANRKLLENDLGALQSEGILDRHSVPVMGVRGIDISPDGQVIMVGGYFSGDLVQVSVREPGEIERFDLGFQPPPDEKRRGEIIFHDAVRTHQHWLSCATCHPDGRSDGLNWDLLNDGIGNPKNTKSLVLSHLTPPSMSTGVRASYDVAVSAGFKHIQFSEATPDEIGDVKAYIRSLEPEPSPYLIDGELSPEAQQGARIFRDSQVGCIHCHAGTLFTNRSLYDAGTRNEYDRNGTYDTPTLLELWRTGPYLHDGDATTLRTILTFSNLKEHHGRTRHLSQSELQALTAYLLSL